MQSVTNRIETLRKNGVKVRVIHYRHTSNKAFVPSTELKETPLAKGGRTKAELCVNGQEFVGESNCHENDAFNRHMGTVKALGRAIGELQKAGVVVEGL